MQPLIKTLRKAIEELSKVVGDPSDLESILIVLGAAILLLFGRKLYWFVLGATGFIGGFLLGELVFSGEPRWLMLIAPVLVGLVASVLGIFLQKLALRLAGLIVGGGLAFAITHPLLENPWPPVALILGSLLGFWLVIIWFDWALILLSSFLGAYVIVAEIPVSREPRLLMAGVLVILGVAAQASLQGPPKKDSKRG
tara:strand:+ start:328 stop:918 length:591 start_codon:yes stop_codon:yes gene_type:complete